MKPWLCFVVFFVGIALLAGCTGPSGTPEPGLPSTQDPGSAGQAPESQIPLAELVSLTDCFSGPGTAYDLAGALAAGGFYRITGLEGGINQIDDEVTWLRIDPTLKIAPVSEQAALGELSPQPDPPGSTKSPGCWIPRSAVNLSGDPQGVPPVEMPTIRILATLGCRPGAGEANDTLQTLETGMSYRVVGIGTGVVQIDDEVTWSQATDEPTWFEIDDEITWFRIAPNAVIDPEPPMLPSGEMRLRCWVPGDQVEILGDLNQVPVIENPAVLIGTEAGLRPQEESPVEVEAVCDRALGDQPALQVSRAPETSASPAITVDGEDFEGFCHSPEPGVLLCAPLPGEAGSTHTIRTCYPEEACDVWSVSVPFCPEPTVSEAVPVCDAAWADQPAVRVSGPPATLGEVWVSVDGEPVDFCHAPDSGVKQCLPLNGDAGSWVVVTTCRTGEGCQYWPMTVSDCAPEPEIGYDITATCYYSPARYQATILTYEGTDARLAIARANGVDLICSGSAGRYSCHGIPGEPGDEVNLTFCLTYGGCFSGRFTASDCGAGSAGSPRWRIVSTGCHDRERIYFILDTAEAWLVPGAEFTYTAYDGTTWYSCEVNPTIPGRLYCSGIRPGSAGQLQVCIQQGSSPRTCNTFLNWPTTLAAVASCAPTSVPSAVDACAQWDFGACQNHPACAWDSTPPGRCYTP